MLELKAYLKALSKYIFKCPLASLLKKRMSSQNPSFVTFSTFSFFCSLQILWVEQMGGFNLDPLSFLSPSTVILTSTNRMQSILNLSLKFCFCSSSFLAFFRNIPVHCTHYTATKQKKTKMILQLLDLFSSSQVKRERKEFLLCQKTSVISTVYFVYAGPI